MACKYYIKGNYIGDELALSDFLLGKYQLYDKLGDAVFQDGASALLLEATAKVTELQKASNNVGLAKDKIHAGEHGMAYTEDGEAVDIDLLDKTYMGVNNFIAHFKVLENDGKMHYITPEFIDLDPSDANFKDSYWGHKFKSWEKGKFTYEELALFFVPGATVDDVSNDNSTYKSIIQSKIEEFTKLSKEDKLKRSIEYRTQMKYQWEVLGKIGTVIHAIMEIYMDTTSNLSDTLKLAKIKELKNILYLDNKLINDLADYAKRLKNYLIDTYGQDGKANSIKIYTEQGLIKKGLNEANEDGHKSGLFGIIDLLVIDKDGNAHIFDYKTSTHTYDNFNDAKRRAFHYLLGAYARMLSYYGFNSDQITAGIIPIEILGLHIAKESSGEIRIENLDHTDSSSYWNNLKNGTYARPAYVIKNIIPFNKDKIQDSIKDITSEMNSGKFNANLNRFIPYNIPPITLTNLDAIEEINKAMSTLFNINRDSKKLNDDEIKLEIADAGGFKPTIDNKLYFVTRKGTEITLDVTKNSLEAAQALMLKRVKEDYDSLDVWRDELYKKVKSYIKAALTGNVSEDIEFGVKDPKNKLGSNTWLRDRLDFYLSHRDEYELIESPLLDAFQILVFYNKDTNAIHGIKVSVSDLKRNALYNNENRLLTANFENDEDFETSTNGKLMLSGVYGNIEAFETMLVLNNLANLFKSHNVSGIDFIDVINPTHQSGLNASNDELLYSYRRLLTHCDIKNDNIGVENAPIHFNSNFERMENLLASLLSSKNPFIESWQTHNLYKYTSLLTDLIKHKDLLVDKLQDLILQMAKDPSVSNIIGFSSDNTGLINEKNHPAAALYNSMLMALAELKGITFTLQILRYAKYLDKPSLRDGVSGMYTDNPGNLRSDTLNLITTAVLGANLNVRDAVMRDYGTLQDYIANIKRDKNFNYFSSRFVHKNSELYVNEEKDAKGNIKYSGMLYRDNKGDLMFANPWVNDEHSNLLTDAQREFLKYVITKLNEMRFGPNMENVELLRSLSDSSYFLAPLIAKETNSVSPRNILKLSSVVFGGLLHPSKVVNTVKTLGNLVMDIATSRSNWREDAYHYSDADHFYEMVNLIDNSYNEKERNKMLEAHKNDDSYFENNIETMLLKAEVAYNALQEINEVFPLIKASILHLLLQGTSQNTVFDNELQYLNDYVKNKIKNEELGTEDEKEARKVLSKFRSAASFFMLAFAPVQYFYLLVDGIWKGILLLIRGDAPFTKGELFRATKIVSKEMLHFGDNKTKLEQLNMLYGLNDMDMNTYADKIKSDQVTFVNIAYRCASRPDFYNRMILLTAQMLHDGTWDAYYLDSKGNLKYDWKLDKRFAAFANDPQGTSNDSAYKKAKAHYIATMLLLIKEGVKNEKGERLVLDLTPGKDPMPIPRAYTNLEIMSIKSIGDNLYGYYSHETKSMILSMTIGALWMLYRTYWSGKKNLYLAHGGTKLRGHWETSKTEFLRIDPDTGLITITNEDTGIPRIFWKGDWQEGIFVSLANIAHMGRTLGTKETIKFLKSDNPKAEIYMANLRLLSYDLTMFLLVGSLIGFGLNHWVDDKKKEAKEEKSFKSALQANSAVVLAKILSNSFLDLNMFDSIGGPVANWTPVSIAWAARLTNELSRVVFEGDHLADMFKQATGVGKLNSVIIDWFDDRLHAEFA